MSKRLEGVKSAEHCFFAPIDVKAGLGAWSTEVVIDRPYASGAGGTSFDEPRVWTGSTGDRAS